jgi:hypothetical protein
MRQGPAADRRADVEWQEFNGPFHHGSRRYIYMEASSVLQVGRD